MVDSSGDWQCPTPSCVNHTKMVFGSKMNCPRCGAAKDGTQVQNSGLYSGGAFAGLNAIGNDQPKPEKGMQGGDMPDDWQCPNQSCINHTKMVFGKRMSCPSCGTARNAKQPGDWQCPNPQCLNHRNTVFASKTMCPKCGTPRSYASIMQMATMRGTGSYPMNGFGNGFRAQLNNLLATTTNLNANGSINPGDWQCPNPSCMNSRTMVFAKHATCPKCGACKGPTSNVARDSGNPGDWQCPNTDCLNNKNKVFAKHQICPSCGAEKPSGFMGRDGRSRSPYHTMAS